MSYSPLPNSSFSPRNPSDNTGDRPMSYFQREPVELELTELPRTQSDFSHSSRSHLPEKRLETVALNQSRSPPRARRHGKARSAIRKIWLTVFLPAVAFAYLAFCYVTATRLVPVRIWMINEPANHLYGIKAGVTTITIIVVAIALLPLKSLLDDIKSEEFFRTLHKSPSGVPLKDINSVSIPSNPLGRSILTVLQNRTSKYYAGAILSGILAALISSLAPAALSVGLVSADSDTMALEVGAIGKDSVYIFGSGILGNTINDVFQNMAGEAASMGWVRNVLGAEIAFIPTSSKYGVPVPLSLDPTVRARYLTDVVVMDPICKWTAPSSPIDSNDTISSNIVLDLPDFGFQIQKLNSSFRFAMQNLKSLDVAGDDTSLDLVNLLNSTSMDPITDGSMAWIISRCTSCKPPVFSSDQSVFDLSEIPTREYSFNDTAATSYTVEYSALVCNPRVSIETREVVLDGTGKLEVMESAGLTAQGNLHLLQTTMLLGNGLMKYTSDSGPATPFTEVGRAAQVKMFFGPDLGNSTKTPVLKPQSIEKITEQYGLAQQAALRSYLSGAIATAYVPGRIQVTKLVFTSSLPHIIVSTILFLSVALFINICYLRADMEQFTLFSVATALARSNVGPVCEDAKVTDRAQKGGPSGDAAVVLVEDRRVYLSNHGGPGPSLHME